MREPTPIAAPIACTASTPPNARSALGVCSSVSTDDASWMTASEIAAISSGPPSADATTQRDDEPRLPAGEVAAAVVRAAPHTIARTATAASRPSSRPPIDTGTWCTPSHMLAIAPKRAGHVAVGDEQLQQHHRGDDDQRDDGRPERDPEQFARLACADWPGVHELGRSSH